MLPPIITFAIFLLIISVLIFVHEFGHFIAAKRSGIGVEEFGFGYPPRLWGKKIRGTIYSVNLFPVGGFVRIAGVEPADWDPQDPTDFLNRSPGVRAKVMLGGITLNLLAAIVIYYLVLTVLGFRSFPVFKFSDFTFPFGETEETSTVVTAIETGLPADEAGVEFGDYLVRLEAATVEEGGVESVTPAAVEPTSPQDIQDFLSERAGQPVRLTLKNIRNGDGMRQLTVVPEYDSELGRAIIGIQLGEVVTLVYNSPRDRLLVGPLHSLNVLAYSLSTFSDLVRFSWQERDLAPVASGVSGPVGIFALVREIIGVGGLRSGLMLLDLTALLSLSLAVINLLPIPALDGGQLLFVLLEKVSRRRLHPRYEAVFHRVGMALLMVLFLAILVKDLRFL